MAPSADRIVDAYLKRLRAALGDLPRERRRAVAADVAARIAEARSRPGAGDEAEVRALLDRIGDPLDIAAAERARLGPRPSTREETTTILLVLLGGFVFLIGWLVGVARLWRSGAWTTRDKLIGTLLVPGGLAALPVLLVVLDYRSASTTPDLECRPIAGGVGCVTDSASGGSHPVVWAVVAVGLVVAPTLTAVRLARQARANVSG